MSSFSGNQPEPVGNQSEPGFSSRPFVLGPVDKITPWDLWRICNYVAMFEAIPHKEEVFKLVLQLVDSAKPNADELTQPTPFEIVEKLRTLLADFETVNDHSACLVLAVDALYMRS